MFRRNPTGVSGMSPWSQYSGSKRGLRQKGFVEKEGFKPRCVRMDEMTYKVKRTWLHTYIQLKQFMDNFARLQDK